MAVPIHLPLGFLKEREAFRWQRLQSRSFDILEHTADLLPRRAVNPTIGDRGLPVRQMPILFVETGERPALQRVALDVTDAPFDLPLVPRRVWLRRQNHRAVVPGEHRQLRHQFGIEPIGMTHGGAEIVDHQCLRHAAERVKRVLQAAQEVVRRLPKHDFAVRLRL